MFRFILMALLFLDSTHAFAGTSEKKPETEKSATKPAAAEKSAAKPVAAKKAEAKPVAAKIAEAKAAAAEKPEAKGKAVTAPTPSGAAASELVDVVELQLAEQIQDRQPVQPTTSFSSGKRFFTWVKLQVKQPETQIKMRWAQGETKYVSSPITVHQSSGWRTWQARSLAKPGEWKVEILDANDQVVHTEAFTIN